MRFSSSIVVVLAAAATLPASSSAFLQPHVAARSKTPQLQAASIGDVAKSFLAPGGSHSLFKGAISGTTKYKDGQEAAPSAPSQQHQQETPHGDTIQKDYRLMGMVLGGGVALSAAGPLLTALGSGLATVGVPVAVMAGLLGMRTSTLELECDDTSFWFKGMNKGNRIIGGQNRWDYANIVNYEFFPKGWIDEPQGPLLVYFKEVGTDPEKWTMGPGSIANSPEALANGAVPGQVHFLPAMFDCEKLRQEFVKHNVPKLQGGEGHQIDAAILSSMEDKIKSLEAQVANSEVAAPPVANPQEEIQTVMEAALAATVVEEETPLESVMASTDVVAPPESAPVADQQDEVPTVVENVLAATVVEEEEAKPVEAPLDNSQEQPQQPVVDPAILAFMEAKIKSLEAQVAHSKVAPPESAPVATQQDSVHVAEAQQEQPPQPNLASMFDQMELHQGHDGPEIPAAVAATVSVEEEQPLESSVVTPPAAVEAPTQAWDKFKDPVTGGEHGLALASVEEFTEPNGAAPEAVHELHSTIQTTLAEEDVVHHHQPAPPAVAAANAKADTKTLHIVNYPKKGSCGEMEVPAKIAFLAKMAGGYKDGECSVDGYSEYAGEMTGKKKQDADKTYAVFDKA